MKAATRVALAAQTYNGTLHWYGHGNDGALLLYKAHDQPGYWPLPVKPTRIILNATRPHRPAPTSSTGESHSCARTEVRPRITIPAWLEAFFVGI